MVAPAACMAINALPLLPLSPAAPLSRMQDIVDYYVQYGEALGTMLVVGSVGAMFLLVFLLGLGTYLRRLQDRPSLLTTGVVTAGVAVVTMNLIANAASLSIVLNAGRVEDIARIQLLHDFAKTIDVLMSLPIAAVVAFTSGIARVVVVVLRGDDDQAVGTHSCAASASPAALSHRPWITSLLHRPRVRERWPTYLQCSPPSAGYRHGGTRFR